MEQTRYYRFEQSDIVVRVSGTVVEKRGADNVWKRAPELLYKFASGDVNLVEISEAEANASEGMRPCAHDASAEEDSAKCDACRLKMVLCGPAGFAERGGISGYSVGDGLLIAPMK